MDEFRKCKECGWLTENNTYTLCHVCGGELVKYELPQLSQRLTPRAGDVWRAQVIYREGSTATRA